MKKRNIIFVLLLAALFIINIRVKADQVVVEDLSHFVNLSCTGNYYHDLYDSSDTKYAKLKDNYVGSADKLEDKITCKWDDYTGNIERYKKSEGAKSIEVKVTYVYSTTFNEDFDLSYVDYEHVIQGAGVITSANFNYDSSRVTITCNVGSDKCTFVANRDTMDDNVYTFTGTITYDKSVGGITQANVTGRVLQAAIVYANDGGQNCGLEAAGWVKSDVHQYLYQHSTKSAYTLPTCTAKSSTDNIKFVGWGTTNGLNTGTGFRTPSIGNCDKNNLKPGGTSMPAGSSGATGYNVFYACFDYKERVYLYTNGQSVTDSSWTQQNGVYYKDEKTVTLPNIESNNPNAEFLGWRIQGGNTNTIAAGTSYTIPDGKTVVNFVAVYGNNSTAYTYSYTATLFMGQGTKMLSGLVSELGGVKFDSCEMNSSGSKAALNVNNGECLVTPTAAGSDTIIATKTTDNKTYTYVITVIVSDQDGSTGDANPIYIADHSSSIDDWDAAENPDPGTDHSVLWVGSDLVCRYFNVDAVAQVPAAVDYKDENGEYLGFTIYKAAPQCSISSGVELYGLCLDPGQRGPGNPFLNTEGHDYQYSRKLDIVSSETDAGLYSIIQKYQSTYNNGVDVVHLAAANFAGRVFSFVRGDINNNNKIYQAHHNAYRNIADNTGRTATQINVSSSGDLGMAQGGVNYNTSRATFLEYANDYYKEAVTRGVYSQEDVDNMEIRVDNLEESGSWPSNTTLVMHNKGTLKFPTGTDTNSITITPNCTLSSDYSCRVVEPANGKCTSDVCNYDLEITVNVNKDTPVPDDSNLEELSFKVEFETTGSAGSGYIITHSTYSNVYQRLILINAGKTTYLLYVRWPDGLCNLNNPYLDYTRCTDETTCKANINEGVFAKLKCCDLITDKTSYAYEYLCSGGECTYSNFLPQCVYNDESSVDDPDDFDILQINEATGSDKSYKYKCIVAIDNHCTQNDAHCSDQKKRAVTDTKKDLAGNKFSLDAYKDNDYCRVTCKEDWDFSLSAFTNFTGTRARPAGGAFQLTRDIFIYGSRTCVTTKIDYEQYMKDQRDIAEEIVKNWNLYEAWRGIWQEKADGNFECKPFTTAYYTDVLYEHECSTNGTAIRDDSGKITGYTTVKDAHESSECVDFKLIPKETDYNCLSLISYQRDNGTTELVETTSKHCSDYVDFDILKLQTNNFKEAGDIHTTGKCLYDKKDYVQNGSPYGAVANYIDPTRSTDYTIEQLGASPRPWSPPSVPPGGGNCSGCSGNGNNYTEETAKDCNYLMDWAEGIIEGYIESYRDYVDSLYEALEKNAEEFALCQNFEQMTESKLFPDQFKDNSTIERAYNDDGYVYTTKYDSDVIEDNIIDFDIDAQKIDTHYSPFATYDYEEVDYMKQVKPDNYLVPYDDVNDDKMGSTYTSVEDDCSSFVVGKDEMDREIKLCRHYYVTDGFKGKPDGTENENDIYGNEPAETAYTKKTLKDQVDTFGDKTYTFGNGYVLPMLALCKTKDGYSYTSSDFKNNQGQCATVKFYFYEVSYIRQTLVNSSYWRNKGNWYVNSKDEHQFSADLASLSGNKDDWKLLSTKDLTTDKGYNVFPISMNTRRNIYQYVYTFYNIGMYSDNALGRVMGGEVDASGTFTATGHFNHVIEDNSRACFYEVYESVCRCCGEPIVQYTIVYNGQVDTETYIQENGVPFTPSNPNTPGYEAQVGWYTNVVGLANLASSTQRVLGANWQAETPFILMGEYYTTNQGDELIKQIEANADKAYDQIPEYSFTLTPAALSAVRDYNDSHTYGKPDGGNMVIYGNVGFTKEGSQNWEVSNDEADERVRFAHYGSKFLEELDRNGLSTAEYSGRLLINYTSANNVCMVNEGEVASIYNGAFDGKGCRWIDYLTSDNIRLAFK